MHARPPTASYKAHLSTGDPHVAAREPRRASDGLPQVGAGVEEVSPCKIVWNQFEPIRTNYFYFYYFFFVGTRRDQYLL